MRCAAGVWMMSCDVMGRTCTSRHVQSLVGRPSRGRVNKRDCAMQVLVPDWLIARESTVNNRPSTRQETNNKREWTGGGGQRRGRGNAEVLLNDKHESPCYQNFGSRSEISTNLLSVSRCVVQVKKKPNPQKTNIQQTGFLCIRHL